MEDSDFLCPLCCEELDISDRNFYPCKCGYQVCMWCWHRIRESESGLCPACRTPYGDDPHEFSAVDVQEVLKANKERAAAEKKIATSKDDVDRTALANMRVIRRNLVYAVGLPPLAEESLRKPDYFGQYGKINKIVLNRNNPPAGDARRASASAYVTFVHKEDTLACILALDGFYMDGRNIRASYGTSKYCSAFIKSVRCNNPECTYLHSMGEKDDTFTKQEIQAGYVTSGRDVLERQQIPGARRKVGGGGPSATGKASTTPVFPPPTYEEAARPPSLVVPSGAVPRSNSAGAVRSSSLGTSPPNSIASTGRSKSSVLSAASVVAGMHAPEPAGPPPPRTTTLTPLTPLKPRSTSISAKPKLLQQQQQDQASRKPSISAPIGSAIGASISEPKGDEFIGGTIIGGSGLIGGVNRNIGIQAAGSGLLGGDNIPSSSAPTHFLTGLGGEIYTGPVDGDKWTAPVSNDSHRTSSNDVNLMGSAVGSGVIRDGNGAFGAIGGCTIGFNNDSSASGSSTLANMLGINLPTGSGSLASDGNPFWQQQQQQQISLNHPQGNGAIGSSIRPGGATRPSGLKSNSFTGSLGSQGPSILGNNNTIGAIGNNREGVIGAPSTIGAPKTNPSIGGMAISPGGSLPSGNGNGKQSDIALLQSLLPGVHITSGQGQQHATPEGSQFGSLGSNWNNGREMDKTWSGGFQGAPGGGVIGVSKQQHQNLHQLYPQQQQQQTQQQEQSNNIW